MYKNFESFQQTMHCLFQPTHDKISPKIEKFCTTFQISSVVEFLGQKEIEKNIYQINF